MPWARYQHLSGNISIIPMEDLIDHTFAKCVCIPAVTTISKDGHKTFYMFTHHSLDGRELSEGP